MSGSISQVFLNIFFFEKVFLKHCFNACFLDSGQKVMEQREGKAAPPKRTKARTITTLLQFTLLISIFPEFESIKLSYMLNLFS